ncbi:hypothetical protein LXL04_005950 [Taraxacum kok-saghyz]
MAKSGAQIPCSMAKSVAQIPVAPAICDIHQENPITGSANFGDLAEDIVTIVGDLGSAATVDRFLVSCSGENLLTGLATGAKGMLGLGRSKIASVAPVVRMSDSVMCLGFVDGGLDMSSSVVLGGYQMEDHILEFNLETAGFKSDRIIVTFGWSSLLFHVRMSFVVSAIKITVDADLPQAHSIVEDDEQEACWRR